jgi:hypothetical protein
MMNISSALQAASSWQFEILTSKVMEVSLVIKNGVGKYSPVSHYCDTKKHTIWVWKVRVLVWRETQQDATTT